jgi:hypothetical protein
MNDHKFLGHSILLSIYYAVQSDASLDDLAHCTEVRDGLEPQFSIQVADGLLLVS